MSELGGAGNVERRTSNEKVMSGETPKSFGGATIDGGGNIFYFERMDASLLEDLISKNQPLRIETASGRVFEVPHRDFISFSPRKTTLSIFYEEGGEEHFALVPLLTVTAAMVRA